MQHMVDYLSPVGMIEITGTEDAICSIMFSEREEIEHRVQENTPSVVQDCYHQLIEYFNGARKVFTFPIWNAGTPFQKNVWSALTSISFGETATYKEIAVAIGNEKSIRAVGNANGKNKLNIVVPCHRIIGSNGKLTGYGGGLWRKEWLLQHENVLTNKENNKN
ncbi:methylated-DNA--[protein]-cysteine S-methyltransferase [Priestia taiwanensis]|uniref:Methylated-DNA--protein-cysteine methyltransferase n=1 Tax=Priestia taiwanensis TaxID=1347902 RepID=A0A917APT3_9BACI|nr:methylated-DNA--[protein]-cysteine S-methyltransferase [Priestia taiwanensis]MBM7362659.1 methylated-DNA-[protein]-cysteine S-methyltransferase [Priestia taiwanensis]GGE64013.1 methylated-DNA--protein-cysteine methyltransferase [Priestia taiwanensis]